MGNYAIHYRGELVEGRDPERVADSLAELFRIDPGRARRIVAARDSDLRSGLEREEAERYRLHLAAIGMRVEVVERGEALPPPPPGAAREPALAPNAASAVEDTPPRATMVAPGQSLPFLFSGTGGGYFRIWIVNITLTLLTAGIYSAWAKVRTERYFYANTSLDGASFDYLASPLSILKGRLIAFLLLVIYLAVGSLLPLLQPLILLLALPLLPWLIVRSLAFRAANSAYRNLRFGFDGDYMGAARAYLLWPLAGLLTFGILMPLALHRQDHYLVSNSRYGTTRFQFDGVVADYYRMALWLMAVALVSLLAIGAIGGFAMVGFADMTGGDFQNRGSPASAAVVMAPIMVSLLSYLLLFAIYTVRRANLRFNGASIDGNRFESSLGVAGWSAIQFTNWLLILVTLGLFRPWARVRNARYRSRCLQLAVAGSLDHFIASETGRVTATGEEIGEAFDVDVAL